MENMMLLDSERFMEAANEEWTVVHTITRAQLLVDGFLVDVSAIAAEAGFKVPVAMTTEVWSECVRWTAEDSKAQRTYQDQEGRLWDVVWMAMHAARACHPDRTQVQFGVYRVARNGVASRPTLAHLKLMIGPGDQGEPVATILLPYQD